MRIIFKILAAPFVVLLTVVIAVMHFFFMMSSWIFVLASSLAGVAGVIMLFYHDMCGIGVLVMAFLVSPFGLPAIAAWLVDLLDNLNHTLRSFIVS